MRSELQLRGRVLLWTVFFLVVLFGAFGCRELYEPLDPVPVESGRRYDLEVSVVPPVGVEASDIRITYENGWFREHDDPHRLTGMIGVGSDGRVTIPALPPGLLLLRYRWSGAEGRRGDGYWGVIRVPRPAVRIDLKVDHLTVRGAPGSSGEVLQVREIGARAVGRLHVPTEDGVRVVTTVASASGPGDSLSFPLRPGTKNLDVWWDLSGENEGVSVRVALADSVDVPEDLELAPALDRAWLDLRLGGEPLRNVEVNVGLSRSGSGEFDHVEVELPTTVWRGEARPILGREGPNRISVNDYAGSLPSPRSRIWSEFAAGDTIRIDLGKNRVDVELYHSSGPFPHGVVQFEPQRLDLDGSQLQVDHEGKGELWLPDGNYLVELARPSGFLLSDQGTIFRVRSDTTLQFEVVEP